jgi:DNA-binding transcriptional regulator YhcF (GntR family)
MRTVNWTSRTNLDCMPSQPEAIRLDSLYFVLDREAEVPIGVQLAWALRARIRDGRFRPGQRLPGLRELAEGLGVNANTVRAVYQRLEHEGMIDSHQGSGTFVANTPREPSPVGTIVADAAREARATGVDPREVAAALYVSLEAPAGSDEQEAKRRKQLRAQIATLEQALGEIATKHPGHARAPAEARSYPGPRLLDADGLEQVRAQMIRRLTTIQIAIDESERAQTTAEDRTAEDRTAEDSPRAAATAKQPSRPRNTTRPAPLGT